jgi:hypothetical protein
MEGNSPSTNRTVCSTQSKTSLKESNSVCISAQEFALDSPARYLHRNCQKPFQPQFASGIPLSRNFSDCLAERVSSPEALLYCALLLINHKIGGCNVAERVPSLCIPCESPANGLQPDFRLSLGPWRAPTGVLYVQDRLPGRFVIVRFRDTMSRIEHRDALSNGTLKAQHSSVMHAESKRPEFPTGD